jgi:hypothetical protein
MKIQNFMKKSICTLEISENKYGIKCSNLFDKEILNMSCRYNGVIQINNQLGVLKVQFF